MQRKAAAASTLPGAADAEENIDAGLFRFGRMDHGGHVAVGDQAHGGAGLAHRRDHVGMARPVEQHRRDAPGRRPGFGERADVLVGRRVEVDHVLRIAGPDRDLVHIDVGRVQHVPPSAMAMVAMAPGMFLAHSVVPSSGSTAMSTKPPAAPTFSPMNSVGASSISPSPITAVPSIGRLSRAATGVDRRLIGRLSSPRPAPRVDDPRSVTRTISIVRMQSHQVVVR
jgi:hypothetical protein